MHVISSCIILFMMILNILCKGKTNTDWDISFTPAEVTAVPGLCVVISCNFTYSNAKPVNLQLYSCKDKTQCDEVIENTKLKKFDLDKNKCNININNIKAEDEGDYEIREKEDPSHTNSPRFKITIQDKPVINIPPLREGEPANLSCSAPVPCPRTPPDITWWIKQNEKSIKLKKITFTTPKSLYVATLTFLPTAELHNATIECEAKYEKKIIRNSTTIEVILNKFTTTPIVSPKDKDTAGHQNQAVNHTEPQNAKGNVTGVSNMNQSHPIEDFFQSLGLSRVHTLLVGIATSAVFFSVVLCCWVSCNRTKKPEVLAVPPDSAIHLEAVQTNMDSALNGEHTNEETPLQNQFDVEMSSTQVEITGPAEDSEAGGADANVDYAAIDYSLLKKKPPEEKEEETANTDYAEIKRVTNGRKAPQNQDDQVEMANEGSENQKQNECEEELYSNSQAVKGLA